MLKTILVLGFCVVAYNWYIDCWKNHSKTLDEIGKPIVINILAFYKEYQRYPSLEESEVLFNKASCINVRQREYKEYKNEKGEIYERWANYYCDYKSVTYSYDITVGDLVVSNDADPYKFRFSRGNTGCYASFHIDGRTFGDGFLCNQGSCLLQNWSH